ncbi:acetyl-CoA hydrolase/transferase family protein [Nocardioides stalactiti]|uniref:acetyl-CoA hydrolase/transferase family protein n=1 Tax=Nocardioides stalactiti TaxID=2755356 RepID=UPI00160158E5|nr:acetyl-CoA hydrolase/transferase family protein [Nocardioides stalactiti]
MTSIDLARFVRPGDTLTWGQTCAEPSTLVEEVVRQADGIGGLRCFVGIPAESALTADTLPAGLTVHSYCGSGSNAALHDAEALEIWPVHYSTLPSLLSGGELHVDVVLVQVSPPDEQGRHSLGLGDDYFSAAIDSARVVIAEINDQVPFTLGARTITSDQITAAIEVSRPPVELPTPPMTDDVRAVARQVAGLVPDGATLQFGIGALPEAVLAELFEHRDLGIHSGILNDTAMKLVEAGVANGRRKSLDRCIAVAGLFGGTSDLFRWAHRNPAVELRSTAYTHDPSVLARSHQLVAVNAAIEVDLTGQVNSELAGGRYVGAVGGAVDFIRGANASPGGVPIVALPSTIRGRSRIVSQLSGPVSTPRAEGVVVVTEHGSADLRGATLAQRVERMIAIAHPDHRAELEADAEGVLVSR